jgi:hypothetical protein
MDPQLVTLLSNAGPLGIALLVYLLHVLPKQEKDAAATRETIKDGNKETAAAIDRLAVAVTDQGKSIARIEGALDHRNREPTAPPMPAGSRDHDPISLRPIRGR